MDIDIFWALGKIIVFTGVYILGRFDFAFGWLLPLFFASIQDHFYYKRSVRKAKTQRALELNEKETILQRLDEIPAWVLFPDFERSKWINRIISQLWTRINDILLKSLKDFEPILQQNKILRTFKFKQINLGKISPRITGVKVYDQNQLYVDEVMWDMSICYFGDLELSFSLNGIEGGIKDIELEGLLRIVLKPVISSLPMISAIQIYFLKHPRTNFELTMGLASLDMFATGELIRSILKDQISLFMVYPNKIHIKLDKSTPSTAFELPQIIGIVRVHIFSLQNVEGNEIMFLSVDLGQDYVESPELSIRGSKEDFMRMNFSRDLIAFKDGDEEVNLTLNKRNEDMKTTKIGTISFNLEEIKKMKCITGDYTFQTSEIVSIEICWLPLTYEHGDSCLLQVYIDSGRNIHSKFVPFVELSIGNEVKSTQVSRIEDELVFWERHFNFFIHDLESDKLSVKLIDQNSFQSLGTYSYSLQDLFKRKFKRHEIQAFPLNSSQNYEIVMGLKLNFLKIPK